MEFCKKCNAIILPNMVVCSECGVPVALSEEQLENYSSSKEINSKETVIDSTLDLKDKYPNCDERRKREYQKGMRYDGFYVKSNDGAVFYDDMDI